MARNSIPNDPISEGRLLKTRTGLLFFLKPAGTVNVRAVVEDKKHGLVVVEQPRDAYTILIPPYEGTHIKSFWTHNLSRKWTRAALEREGVVCATPEEKEKVMALQGRDWYEIGDPNARQRKEEEPQHQKVA